MKKQLLYGIGLLLAGCLGMMQAAGSLEKARRI